LGLLSTEKEISKKIDYINLRFNWTFGLLINILFLFWSHNF